MGICHTVAFERHNVENLQSQQHADVFMIFSAIFRTLSSYDLYSVPKFVSGIRKSEFSWYRDVSCLIPWLEVDQKAALTIPGFSAQLDVEQ